MWRKSAQDVSIAINTCVKKSFVAHFQSPQGGIDELETGYQPFIHVTWSTGLLGVIDDMFL